MNVLVDILSSASVIANVTPNSRQQMIRDPVCTEEFEVGSVVEVI